MKTSLTLKSISYQLQTHDSFMVVDNDKSTDIETVFKPLFVKKELPVVEFTIRIQTVEKFEVSRYYMVHFEGHDHTPPFVFRSISEDLLECSGILNNLDLYGISDAEISPVVTGAGIRESSLTGITEHL